MSTLVLLGDDELSQIAGSPKTKYRAEVGWGQGTAGLFTFGTSRFGGTDVLAAAPWSRSFTGPNDDLSSRVRQITVTRGANDDLSVMQAGTISLTVDDFDGLLNDRNVSSPLYGVMKAKSPLRIEALLQDGVTWKGIYYGFVDTCTSDPGASRYGTATITATDFFSRLSTTNSNLGALLGASTGSAIGAMLDNLQWTDPAMRSLAIGDTLPSPYSRFDGTTDDLTLVEELLTTERGYFYVAGNGAVIYKDRHALVTSPSLTTFAKIMRGAPIGEDASSVVTRWTVSRTDMAGNPIGTDQVAAVLTTDPEYRAFGYVDNSIQTPNLNSDAQALYLAQFLLAQTRSPTIRGWAVPIIPPDGPTLDALISRDLGDRVTMTVKPDLWAAYTSDWTIRQIVHQIDTQNSPRHQVTWRLLALNPVPFRFGISTFGGTDELSY